MKITVESAKDPEMTYSQALTQEGVYLPTGSLIRDDALLIVVKRRSGCLTALCVWEEYICPIGLSDERTDWESETYIRSADKITLTF
jgi:hypothetical protein